MGDAMRRALFIAALSACFVGAVQLAYAADMPTKAPMPAIAPMAPPVVAYNWTGFYIGGHFGGGWGHHTVTNVGSLNSTNFPAGTSFSGDTSGVLGGAQIGYDWQFNPNWLVGIAGDWAWTGIKGDDVNPSTVDPTIVNHTHRETTWLATLTGRIGYVAANDWLLYAKGGAAWAHGKSNSFTTNAAGATLTTTESSSTRSGWTVGAGTEYRFARNWSIFAEYDYVDFGTKTISNNVTFGTGSIPTGSTLLRDNKSHLNIIKGGVNFRF